MVCFFFRVCTPVMMRENENKIFFRDCSSKLKPIKKDPGERASEFGQFVQNTLVTYHTKVADCIKTAGTAKNNNDFMVERVYGSRISMYKNVDLKTFMDAKSVNEICTREATKVCNNVQQFAGYCNF